MSGGYKAAVQMAIGAVFLLAIIPATERGWEVTDTIGFVAGALWGFVVPALEAAIRGGLLVPRRIYGYLTVLALPPVASIVAFFATRPYARTFAMAAFGTWLLATGILALVTAREFDPAPTHGRS